MNSPALPNSPKTTPVSDAVLARGVAAGGKLGAHGRPRLPGLHGERKVTALHHLERVRLDDGGLACLIDGDQVDIELARLAKLAEHSPRLRVDKKVRARALVEAVGDVLDRPVQRPGLHLVVGPFVVGRRGRVVRRAPIRRVTPALGAARALVQHGLEGGRLLHGKGEFLHHGRLPAGIDGDQLEQKRARPLKDAEDDARLGVDEKVRVALLELVRDVARPALADGGAGLVDRPGRNFLARARKVFGVAVVVHVVAPRGRPSRRAVQLQRKGRGLLDIKGVLFEHVRLAAFIDRLQRNGELLGLAELAEHGARLRVDKKVRARALVEAAGDVLDRPVADLRPVGVQRPGLHLVVGPFVVRRRGRVVRRAPIRRVTSALGAARALVQHGLEGGRLLRRGVDRVPAARVTEQNVAN